MALDWQLDKIYPGATTMSLMKPSVKRALFRDDSEDKFYEKWEDIVLGSSFPEQHSTSPVASPKGDGFWKQMKGVLSVKHDILTRSSDREQDREHDEEESDSSEVHQKESINEGEFSDENVPCSSNRRKSIEELRSVLEKHLNTVDQRFAEGHALAGMPSLADTPQEALSDTSNSEDSCVFDASGGSFPYKEDDSRGKLDMQPKEETGLMKRQQQMIKLEMELQSSHEMLEELKRRIEKMRIKYKKLLALERAQSVSLEDLKMSVKYLVLEQMRWLKEERIQSLKLLALKEKARKLREERVGWLEGLKRNVSHLQAQRRELMDEKNKELNGIKAFKRCLVDQRQVRGGERVDVTDRYVHVSSRPSRSRSFGDDRMVPAKKLIFRRN